MGKLIINNLSLKLEQKEILKNISIELNSNETLVIIGESGAGKTVLTKLLLGMRKSNYNITGEISFDSENILNYDKRKWNKIRGSKISYITQNPMAVFNEFQNIESHVVELFESKLNISKEKYLEIFIENIKKLGFENTENILKKYPFQFSGGQLQRIMFAMILQLNPEILVVDEPTSALDFKNTQIILELLKEFQKNKGILIVVTHDYKFAGELGGKAIIMRNGEIVEKGNTNEILQNPITGYGKELISVGKKLRYKKSDNNE